jgi:hypothetical protein
MLDFEKITDLYERYNIYKSVYIYANETDYRQIIEFLNNNSFSYIDYNNINNVDDYFINSLERVLLISYQHWFVNKEHIEIYTSNITNLIALGEITNENIQYIYSWIPTNNYIIEMSTDII